MGDWRSQEIDCHGPGFFSHQVLQAIYILSLVVWLAFLGFAYWLFTSTAHVLVIAAVMAVSAAVLWVKDRKKSRIWRS